MGIRLIITAESSEELRDLGEYLLDTDDLRGRVRQRLRPPGPEDMGPELDALQLVLGPAGITTATVTAFIAWVRSRRGTVQVTVHGASGRKVELKASNVAALNAEGLQQLTISLLEAVNSDGQSPLPTDR